METANKWISAPKLVQTTSLGQNYTDLHSVYTILGWVLLDSDWFRLVQTGPDLLSLSYQFKLVQNALSWFRLS